LHGSTNKALTIAQDFPDFTVLWNKAAKKVNILKFLFFAQK